MKDYIRFPTVEHFEQFLYAVAYSAHVPAHVKFKRSNILIWRDYQHNFLRVCLSHPLYPGLVQTFLRENETIKVFRPNAYYVLRHSPQLPPEDHVVMVQGRIARIQLDDPSKLNRACEILKDYLYYTSFTQPHESRPGYTRSGLTNSLEAVQGHY